MNTATTENWDCEVDVLILGAGAAGMTAAIVSKNEGLTPLVLEKTDQVGGTSAWSVGMMWFVDSSPMQTAGFKDSFDKARKYFAATVGNSVDRTLQEAYISQGRVALDYMLKHSELEVVAVDYPDYSPELEGGMFGRAHAPIEFDGRKLGVHFKDLRAPLPAFAPFGGMMLDLPDLLHFLSFTRSARSFFHVLKRFLRYGVDRLHHHRGTRLVGGNALTGRLYKTMLDRNIDVWLRSSATRLIVDGNKVTGAEVVRDGQTIRVRARRGIVIATGGYPGNLAMRREHSRQPTVELGLGLPSNVGEGLHLGESVGGRLDHNAQDTGYYVPMSVYPDDAGNVQLWGHFMLDRPKPGFIAVGKDGNRFTNEAASYHAFTLGMFEAGAIPAYLIADAATVKKYGIGVILPGSLSLRRYEKSGYLSSGAMLAELAGKIGVDVNGLQRSVERNNQFAKTGIDEDFGKGSSAYNVYKGDPTHSPNPCLGPIEKGPFYAVKLMPGDFGTSRGLVTGSHGEVLDENNRPISGLYACGNDMNSPVGGHYIGAGITLGPALTFGYLAAMALATNTPIASDVSPEDRSTADQNVKLA
ncbi:Succinate dehydrogenase/fumarate reductase, flavoprotein subunit [Burkholderia sp. YR290]|jgi:succinate dehydrogenase/fumarate reductase flavoprotein subunit|uniref:FAD-binding protein n=1 Tax=Paraburkholderia hospita TaxID=169430 RepID=UPI0009A65068|nr:FAD-binding protein [Paraburkholderia hospita]SKC85430.1 Succinate dehydrogenase/fumarate reductase, flavoprotein subunit [Paraburkholderia hospita]SOE84533.1 Succinate dehydrogenase/fumarate reductase, flavoprotein subunit [Burkholderia sp. YR290]